MVFHKHLDENRWHTCQLMLANGQVNFARALCDNPCGYVDLDRIIRTAKAQRLRALTASSAGVQLDTNALSLINSYDTDGALPPIQKEKTTPPCGDYLQTPR
jgi:hypothetical protein